MGVVFLTSPAFGQGRQMQGGWCGVHGNFTTGYSCPKCASGGATGGGNPGISSQDQAILGAANLAGTFIGQWLRGDPQKAARLQAEAQRRAAEMQREAERIAIAAELRKQESFIRLRGMLKLDNFDGDGGALQLKGVEAGSGGDLALKFGDSENKLGLKLDDDGLKPRGTQAVANTGAPESPPPNTDPMVVDLRNFQRAAYVATLPGVSPDAIIAAAQGDVAIIGLPPPSAASSLAGAGLQQFQEANTAFRQSHQDGQKAAEYFNQAQAQREIAGRELNNMKADLEKQLAQETDPARLAQKHELMGQIFAMARAEHAAWVSAKAELDAIRAREIFDRSTLLAVLGRGPAAAAKVPAPSGPSGQAQPAGDDPRARRIAAMQALARTIGWSADELDRLRLAFTQLAEDGASRQTGLQVHLSWKNILTSGRSETFARAAAQGDGPVLAGSGTQAGLNDCTLFALANATGLPYGVVAGRATLLLRQADWRPPAERADPQKVIAEAGLNGDEVIMLAESFGQAEVVPSGKFAAVLREGRPVLVDVFPDTFPEPNDFTKGHQVVLTKTFQHGGETWFEMMDSYQGPMRRLYLSTTELNTMLVESGVAYRPDPETVPALLRLTEAK